MLLLEVFLAEFLQLCRSLLNRHILGVLQIQQLGNLIAEAAKHPVACPAKAIAKTLTKFMVSRCIQVFGVELLIGVKQF